MTGRNAELEPENTALREAIALAKLPDDERTTANAVIAELRIEVAGLRKELATATAGLRATTASRDLLMSESASLKRQCMANRRELERLRKEVQK